ncbi:MAG TPA: LptF/LptG family permease, partial [Acidobacteriota bacterium]|nr:LptF/LptG family permease [Acidobacteriota bacterium]
MQRINKLVRSDVRGPWLISLILLTFVVFAREFGRLAELLIQKQADVIVTGKVVLCLLPSILVFSLPFSLLIGIMIGLSRLSGDNEITALRAVGTSSWQLVR